MEGATGTPVPGATVELVPLRLAPSTRRSRRTGPTPQGYLRLSQPRSNVSGSYFLVARSGGQAVFDPQQLGFYRGAPPQPVRASLVFTDRSIYRPLQKLFWKVVAYHGRATRAPLPGRAERRRRRSTLLDANDQEVEQADGQDQRASARRRASSPFPPGGCSAAGTVAADAGGPRARSGSRSTSARPSRSRSRTPAERAAAQPARPTLTGEARYYFGLPVTSGTGALAGDPRSRSIPWWWCGGAGGSGAPGAQVVATGTSPLEADGTFGLDVHARGRRARSGSSEDVTYRYAGERRRHRRGRRDPLGRAQRSAWAASRSRRRSRRRRRASCARAAGDGSSVARTNLDGAAAAGQGHAGGCRAGAAGADALPGRASRCSGRAGADGKAARCRPRATRCARAGQGDVRAEAVMRRWPDGAEKARGELIHDAKGEREGARCRRCAPGAYRLRYETTDDVRREVRDRARAGRGGRQATPLAVPACCWREASSVKVGGTARFLVPRGLAGPAARSSSCTATGKRIERRLLTAGKDRAVIELPVRRRTAAASASRCRRCATTSCMTVHAERLRALGRQGAEGRVRHLPRQAAPGRQGDLAGHGEGPPTASSRRAPPSCWRTCTIQSLDIFAPHTRRRVLSLYPGADGVPAAAQPTLGAGDGRSGSRRTTSVRTCRLPDASRDDTLQVLRRLRHRRAGQRGGGRDGAMTARGMADARRRRGARWPRPAPPKRPLRADAGGEGAGACDGAAASRRRRPAGAACDAPAPVRRGRAAQAALRSNFAETAFLEPAAPHRRGRRGGHRVHRARLGDRVERVGPRASRSDLRGGSVSRQTRSVKELMVRPVPAALPARGRPGELKVVVNNASRPGAARRADASSIVDPETNESLLAALRRSTRTARRSRSRSAAGSGTNLDLPAHGARGAWARWRSRSSPAAGDLSDGELRPLPVLPGRMHLAQSRFVTLRDKDQRELTFDDLAQERRPHADQRAAGGHRRRAALLHACCRRCRTWSTTRTSAPSRR